jgi:hypothetical protein
VPFSGAYASGIRATRVVTLAGTTMVERYYSQPPQKSYFIGCSTRGYQAMVEAQRFPWDFNGIIAGPPDMDESDLSVRGIWLKRNFLDETTFTVCLSVPTQAYSGCRAQRSATMLVEPHPPPQPTCRNLPFQCDVGRTS